MVHNPSIWHEKAVQPPKFFAPVVLGLSSVTLVANSACQGCMKTQNRLTEKETDMKSRQEIDKRGLF